MRFAFPVLLLLGAGSLGCGGETDPTEPDLIPPSVSLVDPPGGATVTGVVPLAASAEDSSGIAGVTFRVDGVAITAEDQVAPFAVNWASATVSDGDHLLTAVARDSAGNSTTSTAVSVVVDNTAPTVAVSSPVAGSKVAGTVALAATAADLSGIAGVTFRVDGVAVGSEDLVAPYTVDWNSSLATEGGHVVTAVARDSSGKTSTAAGVGIIVDNVPLGTLRVTLGADGDIGLLTDLRVIIDSGATGPARPMGSFPLDSLLPPGAHTVTLAGIPAGCALAGSGTRATTIATDSVTLVSFEIACEYHNVVAVAVSPISGAASALQLRRPDGALIGAPVQFSGYIFDVAIAPDGRRLVYSTGIVNTTIRLFDLFSQVDSVLVPVAGQATVGMFDWSPDGAQLVYRDSLNGLSILTLATGTSEVIPNGQDANAPDWSPDGQYILFTGIRDTNQSVFRLTPAGTGLTKLTFPSLGTGDTEARWSPDGTKLVLTSTRDGSWAIWWADADGGNLEQITPGGATETFPQWSPEGDRIAFMRGESVWVRTLATGAENLLYSAGASDLTAIHWGR